MPRQPGFPDPDKVSPNSPSVIVPAERVLALYNNANPNGKQFQKVSKTVQTWFENKAHEAGWHSVEFHGDVTGYSGLGAVLRRRFGR
ncbi:MAG: hypothetical protein JJU33_04815 [Phycisphaerales bacterium]|nr:hypothetical protein [Phycisphaerales bacterium]